MKTKLIGLGILAAVIIAAVAYVLISNNQAVTEIRAEFGAAQSHLEHTDRNLGVTSENMTAAESQIRDTDMAEEMVAFTTKRILSNASSALSAHAHALPQMILQLLQE